jgi:hypothetical protein
MDYTRIYQADLVRLLDPQERVMAVVPCRLAYGAERLERRAEVPERRLGLVPEVLRRRVEQVQRRRSGGRSLLDRIIDLLDWPWNGIDWDEVLGGVVVAGRPGSHAVRLAGAARDGVGLFGVVTPQRLAVVRRVATDRFELVVEAPRVEVVEVRQRGRPLHRGRVVIGFADGSRVAVNTGIVLTGQARRLVAALTPAG